MEPWLFVTERLAVRPKTVADSEELHAVYGDDDVMRFCGGGFATLRETRAFVASHMRHQETHGFSMWALLERNTRALVGDVGLLTHEDGIEIGWHLHRDRWGRGYATEAARACLAYGFDQFGFARVSAFTESANTRSIRVIEKLGMRCARGGADGVPAWVEYVMDRPFDAPPPDRGPAATTGRSERFSLWVYTDDCDAAVERLRTAGVHIVEEPIDQPWGERVARVVDPDGNLVIIGQRDAAPAPGR